MNHSDNRLIGNIRV